MSTILPPLKRQKMDGPLIGTHSGHFHADEALAVYLLRLLPKYQSSPLVRTRDPERLAQCHTVVDVGGEYEDTKLRYDHHQRGFITTFDEKHSTKLSSAGLVYKHFGREIIAQITGLDIGSEEVGLLYHKIYDDLIEAFDANDNGISAYDTTSLLNQGIKPRFNDRGFSIASVVNRYNHHYTADPKTALAQNGDAEKTKEEQQEEEDKRFLRASEFTGEQFMMEVMDKYRGWLPARQVVHQAYHSRNQYDSEGRIMVIPYRKEGVPWADHLYGLEAEYPDQKQVLYVLFPENGEKDSKWRVRAVSVQDGGFVNRKDLPNEWKGVRDDELSKVSGIDGCVFVHAGGFIGGNKTFEGALAMAQKALQS